MEPSQTLDTRMSDQERYGQSLLNTAKQMRHSGVKVKLSQVQDMLLANPIPNGELNGSPKQ